MVCSVKRASDLASGFKTLLVKVANATLVLEAKHTSKCVTYKHLHAQYLYIYLLIYMYGTFIYQFIYKYNRVIYQFVSIHDIFAYISSFTYTTHFHVSADLHTFTH